MVSCLGLVTVLGLIVQLIAWTREAPATPIQIGLKPIFQRLAQSLGVELRVDEAIADDAAIALSPPDPSDGQTWTAILANYDVIFAQDSGSSPPALKAVAMRHSGSTPWIGLSGSGFATIAEPLRFSSAERARRVFSQYRSAQCSGSQHDLFRVTVTDTYIVITDRADRLAQDREYVRASQVFPFLYR